MNKFTTDKKINQIKKEEKDIKVNFSLFLEEFKVLSPTVKRVFTYLSNYMVRYPTTFVAQQTIADHLGLSRCTVNESIQVLDELGALAKINRAPKGWNGWRTCLYELNSAFRDPALRREMSFVCKIFKLDVYRLYSKQLPINKNAHNWKCFKRAVMCGLIVVPTLMNSSLSKNNIKREKKSWISRNSERVSDFKEKELAMEMAEIKQKALKRVEETKRLVAEREESWAKYKSAENMRECGETLKLVAESGTSASFFAKLLLGNNPFEGI